VKTINLLCAGNKVLVKYQAQGGFNTTPTPLRTPLLGVYNIFENESEAWDKKRLIKTPS